MGTSDPPKKKAAALRQREDGTTYTATFQMTRVK